MTTRFKAAIAGLAIGVGISLADTAAAENVLRWASAGGALSFDPHAHTETPTKAQLNQIYEKLLDLDSDLKLVPALAVAWRLVAPTTWEFKLRENVRFHGGTPFTGADVAFTIARQHELPGGGYYTFVESIAEVQVVDRYRVHIETKFPDPMLPTKMSPIYIMSERWAKAHDVPLPSKGFSEENYASRHANGTGPFILQSLDADGRTVMVRNRDWWGFERYSHNLDRIEYTPIVDPEQRMAALLQGDLDLLVDPPFAALDRIESTLGLTLVQAQEPRIIFLGLDQASPELRSSDIKGRNPFSDKRVRQAVYQAIDIEEICQGIMRGLATPAGMLLAPGLNGYAPELDQRLPYEPETAKALLAAAGYPEGFRVTLDCMNNSNLMNDEQICRAITNQLGEVGIRVTLNAQDKDVIYAKIDNRESDFYLDSLAPVLLDAHEVFARLYRTGAGLNSSGYSNPRVDEIIQKIDQTMITYGRDALIEEVWKIVLDDVVYVPLHHQMTVWAMRDNLDIPVNPFNRPQFREARLM